MSSAARQRRPARWRSTRGRALLNAEIALATGISEPPNRMSHLGRNRINRSIRNCRNVAAWHYYKSRRNVLSIAKIA